MRQLIIPDEVRTWLAQATGPVDLLDRSGNKVGTYIPEASAEPLIPWDPSITREELDRRANAPGGRSLAEIWQRLGVK
jgi:hypothetical protein